MAFRNWLPSDLETEPAAWLDASDEEKVDVVSGKAAGLIDKSSNGNSALQATEGSRPAVLADAINGLSALDFDGVDDYLAMSTPIISLVHTVFVVAAPTAESAIAALVGQYSAGVSGRHYMGTNQADTGLVSAGRFNVFNNTATSGNGSSGLLDDTAFVGGDAAIFSTINLNTGEGFRFIKDGTVVDTATVTVLQQTNTGIGAERAAGKSALGSYDGLFAEMVVVQAALSDADRKKVEGYLAHKWGIAGSLPPGHDYKDAAPQVEVAEVPTLGTITGTVKINDVAAQRQLIGISYEPQEIEGEEEPRRLVVGETTSAEDGTYTLETPGFTDEVIVLALDNYGEIWRPNRALQVGQRIRPTRGNETGYGYDITIAGDSGTEEPTWWVPAGGSETGSIGAATAAAKPLWWSVAQAPILPTPSEVAYLFEGFRYWRICNIQTGSVFELSEIQLLDGATDVTGFATATATVAPEGGTTLSALFDGNTGTRAYWSQTKAQAGYFAITFDFGSTQLVDAIKQGGFTTAGRHMAAFDIQGSNDGLQWFAVASNSGLPYPGNSTISSAIPVAALEADPDEPGIPASVWDADTVSGATIDATGTIVTDNSTANNWAQGTAVKTAADKFAVEFYPISESGGGNAFIGLRTGSSATPGPSNRITWRSNGSAEVLGASLSWGAWTDGDTLTFVFDNGNLWVAKNGVWVGGGDPATGASPTRTGITGTEIRTQLITDNSAAKPKIQMNAGQFPFRHVPSAYAAGMRG